ncbi:MULTISPECIES: MarR family winged helix-turn-helix transcriptional regulator [Microbacterium]|jgi:DNA-binding MarR family transcriptional regulator|uniref:MarR family transcriptional regulator n=1 Tax=Microbacterium algeriense TaxID=2615184 RepID=A0ABQ6VAN0_9MICO|nr:MULTISPECIES: MarR family transcriptional regulator [Microbacterium]AZH79406.1 MarR family transcriptional regulator [Microbacterium sp. Y-01]KAB1867392.1 MarR family transcriptional regulator [Microbacterium algeriense]MDX2399588.1 MarR family transcriptional regulator [Microbacterium algeriense]
MDSARGTTPVPGAPAHDGLSHAAIYDVEASDPRSTLVDRTGVPPEDLRQIALLMEALGNLRDAEQRLSQASRRYMQLNETDMRALHYLIVCANRELVATPSGIAGHLGVSTAATTKLLDRLERGGHIQRSPHPTDRRALAITITPETRHAAMETVGRQQAKRFYAAARLTPAERDVVIRFLEDMTEEITLRDEPWLPKAEE